MPDVPCMDATEFIVAPPKNADPFEEVALTSPRQATGTVFRKHILNLGTLIHPQTGERLRLDEPWYNRLKANFDSQVCDTVQVPLANDANKHVEDPLRNTGEVIGLERRGNKVYTLLDVRRPDVVEGIRNRTILGSSAFLSMNYTDTRTGQKAGPTLLHNCLTNRPYVVDLDPFEEVIAATAEAADNQGDVELLLTEDESTMDLSELKAELLTHGIDVDALQEEVNRGTSNEALMTALTQALSQSGTLQLTGGVTGEDLVGAVAELAQLTRGQGEEISALKRERAERLVDGYIGVGRLLPRQREDAVEMALTSPEKLDTWVAPADAPYVQMSAQEGVSPRDTDSLAHSTDVDEELARLTSSEHSSRFFTPNGTTKRG